MLVFLTTLAVTNGPFLPVHKPFRKVQTSPSAFRSHPAFTASPGWFPESRRSRRRGPACRR
jgi:hypothetical protein